MISHLWRIISQYVFNMLPLYFFSRGLEGGSVGRWQGGVSQFIKSQSQCLLHIRNKLKRYWISNSLLLTPSFCGFPPSPSFTKSPTPFHYVSTILPTSPFQAGHSTRQFSLPTPFQSTTLENRLNHTEKWTSHNYSDMLDNFGNPLERRFRPTCRVLLMTKKLFFWERLRCTLSWMVLVLAYYEWMRKWTTYDMLVFYIFRIWSEMISTNLWPHSSSFKIEHDSLVHWIQFLLAN